LQQVSLLPRLNHDIVGVPYSIFQQLLFDKTMGHQTPEIRLFPYNTLIARNAPDKATSRAFRIKRGYPSVGAAHHLIDDIRVYLSQRLQKPKGIHEMSISPYPIKRTDSYNLITAWQESRI
jgi:uncharacterized protein (DUF736 family)